MRNGLIGLGLFLIFVIPAVAIEINGGSSLCIGGQPSVGFESTGDSQGWAASSYFLFGRGSVAQSVYTDGDDIIAYLEAKGDGKKTSLFSYSQEYGSANAEGIVNFYAGVKVSDVGYSSGTQSGNIKSSSANVFSYYVGENNFENHPTQKVIFDSCSYAGPLQMIFFTGSKTDKDTALQSMVFKNTKPMDSTTVSGVNEIRSDGIVKKWEQDVSGKLDVFAGIDLNLRSIGNMDVGSRGVQATKFISKVNAPTGGSFYGSIWQSAPVRTTQSITDWVTAHPTIIGSQSDGQNLPTGKINQKFIPIKKTPWWEQ